MRRSQTALRSKVLNMMRRCSSFAKQSSDHTKFCGVWGKAPRSSFPLSLTFTAFAAISGAAGTTAAAASVPYHIPYGEKQPNAYRSDKHIIQYSHCSHLSSNSCQNSIITLYTIAATHHANTVCPTTTNNAILLECSSLFTAAIAATHGV